MNEKTPHYYRITETEDVHHFVARWLQGATWDYGPRYLLCNLLYMNAMRYIIRLPHKGTTPAEMLRDIRKAIHCLEELREALVQSSIDRSVPAEEEMPRG